MPYPSPYRSPALVAAIALAWLLFACGAEGVPESALSIPRTEPAGAEVAAFPDGSEGLSEAAVPTPAAAEPQAVRQSVRVAPPSRTLIRTGSIAYATNNLDSVRERLAGTLAAADAYVASERTSHYDDANHLHLTIRVLAARFDELIARVGEGVDAFDARTSRTQDVTAEYVDLSARLEARRTLEARYLTLTRRAADVDDLLAVERQLARVREEIEVAEGQLRYLTDRSALSTLELHVYEPDTAGGADVHPVAASFAAGWELLVGLSLGLLSIWPVTMMIVVGAWAWHRLRVS